MKNLSKKLILSVGVLALGALATVGVLSQRATAADSSTPATYVGQATCAKCHADKVKDYSMTGHTSAFRPLSDFVVTNPNLKVTITDPDTKTNPTKADVTLDSSNVLGVFMGEIIVAKAPAGFAQKYVRVGDLTPNDNGTYTVDASGGAESFASCSKCHAPGAAVAGQTTSAEAGITCEACHGPGSNHVNATTLTDRKATMKASETPETCYKCHPVDNAPNDNGSKGLPSASSLQAVNHYGVRGFYATKHYTSSKLNSCLTCHDPHVQPDAGYLLNVSVKHANHVTGAKADTAANLCNQCHAGLITDESVASAFWKNPSDAHGHTTVDHSLWQVPLSNYITGTSSFQLGTKAVSQLRTLYPDLFAN